MRERNDTNVVEILNEREPITELAIVNQVAHSTDCCGQLVPFYFALEEPINVIDIETAGFELPISLCISVFFIVLLFASQCIWLLDIVTNRVEVALVNVLARTDVKSFIDKLQLHFAVIDSYLLF